MLYQPAGSPQPRVKVPLKTPIMVIVAGFLGVALGYVNSILSDVHLRIAPSIKFECGLMRTD